MRKKFLGRRFGIFLAILGLVFGSVAVAGPAQASQALCGSYGSTPSFNCVSYSGFTGQQPWGYPVDSSGHNCTNYVTYRLWRNGVANPGNLHNAYEWDNYASSYGIPVNNNPAVGSVAVWEINSGPALGSGHVAYVEAVTSTYIDISEDNYGGTTMRKRFFAGQSDWPDHFIQFGGAPTLPVTNTSKYVVKRVGDKLYAKVGLNDTWTMIAADSVTDFQSAGERFAFRNPAGEILVKDGLNGPWVKVWGYADQYAITSKYIVVRNGDVLRAKAGVNDAWTTIAADGATDVQVAGERFAFRNPAGNVFVKEGLGGPWVAEWHADQYVITPTYIVKRDGDVVYAKVGLTDGWTTIAANNATDVQAAGNRFAIRNPAGEILVKEGLGGSWVSVWGYTDQYVLTPKYIVVRTSDVVYAKVGLNDAWTMIAADAATDIKAAGERFAIRNPAGEVLVKEGLGGPWVWVNYADQYRLSSPQ